MDGNAATNAEVPLRFLDRLRRREHEIFLSLTLLIGLVAGISAVLFRLSINLVQGWLFGSAPSHARLLLIPAGVSLVTGYLLARVFPNARGSGIPQVEAAFHLEKGFIPFRTAVGKFLTGVLCIGSGHSMGREGPSVQIGAALASSIGRWFRLSPDRVQSLVPVGAAAALSAAFNTPVAAVLFALEEIVGDMNASVIGSTVLASVAAVVVERAMLGNDAMFSVPPYQLAHPAELLVYAALGIIDGFISVLFCKGLLWSRALFQRMPASTILLQPAMGGLLVGVILVFVPQVMGVGYQYVNQALTNHLALSALLLLLAAKFAATIISYSSGNAGGIFAPSLFLGGMLGGAVGTFVHAHAPFPTADPGAYAMVGMGALFAGIIRAPMTSVFMIFELTQDYQIMVPLMIANLLSFAISRKYQRIPIYHALLEQDHISLPTSEERATTFWRVRDIMDREPFFIPPDVTVAGAWSLLSGRPENVLVVGTKDHLRGMITREKLQAAMHNGKSLNPITEFTQAARCYVHPDHSVEIAIQRLRESDGMIPVLNRRGLARVEGVITREALVRALGG
jgi:CIC family chloride channel protein